MTYPFVEVYGSEYPMGPTKQAISKALTFVQYGAMALLLFGQGIPQVAANPLYLRLQQNKMMFLIGGYFLFNTLQKTLSQSGAFEVYVEDKLVFSKLSEGRIPEINELLNRVKRSF